MTAHTLLLSTLILAALLLIVMVFLHMKTAELAASVSALSTATSNLSAAIDRAVTILGQTEVTPDADVVATINVIDAQTTALSLAREKLVAVLPT